MLLKRAYTRAAFEELISETRFRDFQIEENLIALEVSLAKDSSTPGFLYF
jgi:hypothetical protein